MRQSAFKALARGASPAALAFVRSRLAELRAGALDSTFALETLEAARRSGDAALRAGARAATGIAGGDSLAAWWPVRLGGDAARGRTLFESHPVAACVRCHSVDGAGGTLGPDLSLAGAHDRRWLSESLLRPNASLARGYETVALTLLDGEALSGALRDESASRVTLDLGGSSRTIPRDSVRALERLGSAMPAMGGLLTPFELRDAIEYLASLRDVRADAPLAPSPGGAPGSVHASAPWRLALDVPADARGFTARLALASGAAGGMVGAELRVDGRRVWRRASLKHGESARAWAALPPGSRRLELVLDDGGNGVANDDAVWSDAGFVR